ncbi:MAG: hypothetical protein ACO1PI_09240 [Bacteroidota bacterium]
MARVIRHILEHWIGYFDTVQYSTQEFYGLTEESINQRELPGVKLTRVKFFQDSSLWAKREYLRVRNREFIFDICAAPYGNGFYVSWYMGKRSTLFYRFMIRVPLIGPMIQVLAESKTYYQIDSMAMFRACIKACVDEAVEKISAEKGVRSLASVAGE